MNVLLDVLAYNTYYTAFNANMVVNELFLDSATLRDNVVAIAKQLGYKPKSKTAPKANVSFSVTFPQTAPKTAKLAKGTGFTTTFDETLYSYVAIDDITAPVENGVAYFDNVSIYEGSLLTSTYVVDTSITQKFIIQNSNVDVSSIRVKVYDSATSSNFNIYDYSDNILNIDANSSVFFIDEVEDERYQIFFGDGVLGKKLTDGQKVEVSYLVTNAEETNGAKNFLFNGVVTDIFGSASFIYNVAVTASEPSNGGAGIESISTIKYNAPKYFATQDRAVTAADYSAIIRNLYPAISDIIIFGGEEDEPPEYGKVKIVIKPKSGSYLSSSTKRDIEKKLKKYMVASVRPEVVDASILYVEVNCAISYSISRTSQRPEEIVATVVDTVNNYLEQSQVEKFNGKFRYSKFISAVDNADPAINSNSTKLTLRKDFFPQINSSSFYEICYQNEFDKDCEGTVVTSSGFKISEYPTYTVYLEDRDGDIALYRIDSLTGDKITLNDSVGTVDYKKGEIMLYDLTIVQGSFSDNRIQLRAIPRNMDITAKREVYLDLDVTQSKFTAYPE